ncbi:MAG: FAD binding domain-containing protein [Thiolinea sp.]
MPLDATELREQLKALQADRKILYKHGQARFYSPQTLDELLELRAAYPQATLLAGGTDVGLWVNKQFRELNPLIYLGAVAGLDAIRFDDDYLQVGATASLTAVYQALHALYPQMDPLWERFASLPVRNAGTLGGNIANGSPIGDSMPALMALGTQVVLRSVRGSRQLALEDLYLDYMKKDMAADEIVEWINIPLPDPQRQFRCYKLSKRHDSDISAVFAGFALILEGDTIRSVRIAFGGMAATPKRASHCEQVLTGQSWDEATVRQAMQALQQDYAPLSDMRASGRNRMQSAQNLLYRFYLETRPDDPLPPQALDVFAQTAGEHPHPNPSPSKGEESAPMRSGT